MIEAIREKLRCLAFSLYILCAWGFVWELAHGDLYFNSPEENCEPGSHGANVGFCDGFEDGTWCLTMDDGNHPPNDGWICGLIMSSIPDPTPGGAYVYCAGDGSGLSGVAGTNCAATSGPWQSFGHWQGLDARKLFAPNQSEYTEMWWRYYFKRLPGFNPGHEKLTTMEQFFTGDQIAICNDEFGSGVVSCINGPEDIWRTCNIAPCDISTHNVWYYVEWHVRIGAGGIYEMYFGNCGTDGLQCTGSPTLVSRYTGINWGSSPLGAWWLENWCQAPGCAVNNEVLYDQFYATFGPSGPIGFMPVGPAPSVADFTGAPLSGTAPLTVNFTDTSTGGPTSWVWDFGDTNTSGAQNPSNQYQNPGSYTVSLDVDGPGGPDNETKPNYITVNAPPVPPPDSATAIIIK